MQMAGGIESLPAKDLTDASVCAWEKTRTTINLREPSNLKTLVAQCEWEQAVSEGHKNHDEPIKWWQQVHMHFF